MEQIVNICRVSMLDYIKYSWKFWLQNATNNKVSGNAPTTGHCVYAMFIKTMDIAFI